MVIYNEVDEKDNPINLGSEWVQENNDGNDNDIIITGLNPGSRYGVTVAGYTRRGDGFRSRSIYVTIERRGMFKLINICVYFNLNA